MDLEQGVIDIRRSVFEGTENTTKSDGGDEDRAREVPIDASVMGELRRHPNGRRFGYVFQTNRGTPLRPSNVLEDVLHPTLKKLNIPKAGMHAFMHGRCSHLVYAGVRRAVIRDWHGRSADAMVDHYTAKLRSLRAQEMAKVKSILDSTLRKESGAQAAWRCKLNVYLARFPGSSTVEHSAVNRRVASSNLARGAKLFNQLGSCRSRGICDCAQFCAPSSRIPA